MLRLLAISLFLFSGVTMNAKALEYAVETAVFAGGCFWCIESELQELDGVYEVISGYTGGHEPDPTYKSTSTGKTGHAEAVRVEYNPSKISYETLLEAFWSNVDPTDAGGQFYDRGSQYRTGIFYMNDEQKKLAEASKAAKEKQLGQPIATEITEASTFYPAEDYHQDYYKTNEAHYKSYKQGSRREETLNKVWGDARPEVQKQPDE